jgi:hypothetical protein
MQSFTVGFWAISIPLRSVSGSGFFFSSVGLNSLARGLKKDVWWEGLGCVLGVIGLSGRGEGFEREGKGREDECSKVTLGVENEFYGVVFKYVPFELHIYICVRTWHETAKMSAAWRIECLSALRTL